MTPGPVDPIRTRDLMRLSGVHPTLSQTVLRLCDQYKLFVVEGVRTVAQQHDRWCQGRDPGGRITNHAAVVTYCDGIIVPSHHQPKPDGYGHAVDVAFRGPDAFPTDRVKWDAVGEAAEDLGLTWGGRFRAPVDLDHLELPYAHPVPPAPDKAV